MMTCHPLEFAAIRQLPFEQPDAKRKHNEQANRLRFGSDGFRTSGSRKTRCVKSRRLQLEQYKFSRCPFTAPLRHAFGSNRTRSLGKLCGHCQRRQLSTKTLLLVPARRTMNKSLLIRLLLPRGSCNALIQCFAPRLDFQGNKERKLQAGREPFLRENSMTSIL